MEIEHEESEKAVLPHPFLRCLLKKGLPRRHPPIFQRQKGNIQQMLLRTSCDSFASSPSLVMKDRDHIIE